MAQDVQRMRCACRPGRPRTFAEWHRPWSWLSFTAIQAKERLAMRTVRSSRFLVFCALALALVVPPVHAQVAGGSISGSVLDSSGAVLPRAQVLIRNVETGV